MSSTTVVFSSTTTAKHTQKTSAKRDREAVAPKTFTVSSSSLAPRAIKNIKVKIDEAKLEEARAQH